jgi:hypothetical protein
MSRANEQVLVVDPRSAQHCTLSYLQCIDVNISKEKKSLIEHYVIAEQINVAVTKSAR